MTRDELQKVRDWANGKIATGAEPPWSWFQLMKLREDLDQILAGMSVVKTESSPQSEAHSGTGPRLAVSNVRQGSAPHHPQVVETQLPT
jgi:hypothetical protein